MNIFQAASAFKLWTNKDMPIEIVKRIALDETLASSTARGSHTPSQ